MELKKERSDIHIFLRLCLLVQEEGLIRIGVKGSAQNR